MSVRKLFEKANEKRDLLLQWETEIILSLRQKQFQFVYTEIESSNPHTGFVLEPTILLKFYSKTTGNRMFHIKIRYTYTNETTKISMHLSEKFKQKKEEALLIETKDIYQYVLSKIPTFYTEFLGKNRLELLVTDTYIIEDKSSLETLELINEKK